MADDVTLTTESATGTQTAVCAADDIGGVLYQRVKVVHGADGSATDTSSAAPLPVTTTPSSASSPNVDGAVVSVDAVTGTTVLAAFSSRRQATIIPEGDVYMRLNGTAANTHAKLPAYTPYNISGYTGSVSMLSVSGTINVNVWEF